MNLALLLSVFSGTTCNVELPVSIKPYSTSGLGSACYDIAVQRNVQNVQLLDLVSPRSSEGA